MLMMRMLILQMAVKLHQISQTWSPVIQLNNFVQTRVIFEQMPLLFNIIVGVNLEPEIAKDDWTSGSVV